MELCVTSEISSRALDGAAIPFAEGAALAARAGFSQMDYSFSAAALLADGWEQAALERQRQAQDAGIALRYAHLPFDYPRDPGKWPDFSRPAAGRWSLPAVSAWNARPCIPAQP